jgi:tetratricopeptide (TPR) repeat protein
VNIAHVDELDAIELPDGFVWRPVRKHFGIRAFGTNAYTPGAAGRIVEEHTEEQLGHQEIYLVLRGRVRFTIGEEEHELGAGQLVFLREPSLRRGAVALEDDSVVLAVGGKPGAAHEISPWEYFFAASPHIRAGRYDEAKRLIEEGLGAKPGSPALLYNLACVEALAGETDNALQHLNEAVAADEHYREYARTDEDFASIRDDPRFPAL